MCLNTRIVLRVRIKALLNADAVDWFKSVHRVKHTANHRSVLVLLVFFIVLFYWSSYWAILTNLVSIVMFLYDFDLVMVRFNM